MTPLEQPGFYGFNGFSMTDEQQKQLTSQLQFQHQQMQPHPQQQQPPVRPHRSGLHQGAADQDKTDASGSTVPIESWLQNLGAGPGFT